MKKSRILLFLLITAAACNNKPGEDNLIHNAGEALGTTYSIMYESKRDFHEDITEIYEQVNRSMSTYRSGSDISRINRGEEDVVVDSLFIEVFQASQEVWKATNGYFDPTIGPVINALGFGPEKKLKEIDNAVIDSLLVFVGLEKVQLTAEKKVLKQDPRIFIDFNAIAKGYTVDLIGRMLESKGVENYLIELGGELKAKGINTAKKKEWTVAVDNPTKADERALIKTLRLKDKAMATSGNYRKFHLDTITGEKYVHSINPKTGKSQKNNILSVSVMAETCMYADAYATAFMVMDFEASKQLLSKGGLDVYIIYLDNDGNLQEYLTEGFLRMVVE